MVSFQAIPLPLAGRKGTIPAEIGNNHSSKKRKWDDSPADQDGFLLPKTSKPADTTTPFYEIELHLEPPLPLEWERCLDIQSGQIHFYNTRTHKRTSRDPRRSPEPPSPDHVISLDLQLNLPCEPKRNSSGSSSIRSLGDLLMDSSREKRKNPASWLTCEKDPREMVATVCTKCHLLVMLCKTSPACPNCKFMNLPDQTSCRVFKERLSLLC